MKPYYRILRLNHGRAPTVQHATLKDAETEALRLAGQHPGETFEILQCLGIARTATPVIEWNDWAEPPIQAVSLAPKPYSAPKLGEGFRYLECREVIEPGDEVWIEHRGEWIPYDPVAFGTRQHLASVGRRKLPEPAAPAEHYPTTPLPEGFDRPAYRMLEPGERIEEGDECSASGSWLPVHSHVVGESLFACNVGFFRRPTSNTSKP